MSLRPTQSSRGHDAGSHSAQASQPVAAGTAVPHLSGGASHQAGKDAGAAQSGAVPGTAGSKKREYQSSCNVPTRAPALMVNLTSDSVRFLCSEACGEWFVTWGALPVLPCRHHSQPAFRETSAAQKL